MTTIHAPTARQSLLIRDATVADASAVADIYNQGIRARIATFETIERTAADVEGWVASTYPFLVAETRTADGARRVLGWVRASEYRPRECYRGIVEFSVYVDEDARARGVGDALMTAFIPACSRDGFWKVLSRIFPENAASRALCARHRFREVGTYEKHARLDGVWRDVVIVERVLEQRRFER